MSRLVRNSNWRRAKRWIVLKSYRLIRKIKRSVSNRNYLILVSILIGIAAGLAGMALKYLVFVVREWMRGNDPTQGQIGFVFFPILGILLTRFYVKYVHGGNLQAGFTSLIHRISRKQVNLPVNETYSHVVGSSLTVGLGGSVGLEAPIVRTGAAIGANLGRILQVGRNQQTLLLACGSAAGMASIFNSPVAGVLFAFEVLISNITIGSFIPIIIASATGAVVARYFYYEQLFYFSTEAWTLESIPFYVVLGVICGFYSVYMIRSILYVQKKFDQYPNTNYKLISSYLIMGFSIFAFPALFGEGYDTVNHLLLGEYEQLASNSFLYPFTDFPSLLLILALVVILVKAPITSLTLAMGGNGGVFAPAMFSGAILGFIFSFGLNHFTWSELQVNDFIVVAMAGILSGVIKSPLTGIFLIAEITGGYSLFVPLMIVSALSYFITYPFEPHSIFTRELYFKGLWRSSHEKDLQVLDQMNIDELIETNFAIVNPWQSLGEFVEIIPQSNRNLFPVLDENDGLSGVVLLDDIREIMFLREKYDRVFVSDLMHYPPAIIHYGESMEKIMEKFDVHQAWNLPVVKGGKYIGFISRSSVFNQYRNILKDSGKEA